MGTALILLSFYTGTYDKVGSESNGTIGWAVTYNNEDSNFQSTCTWSGRRKLVDGNPVISTTWLLTKQNENEWESVHINKDFFCKDKIVLATIKKHDCKKSV